MSEELADVVPLCRTVRSGDRPGVRCSHCSAAAGPRPMPAVLLPLPLDRVLTDDDLLAGEL